MRRTRLIAAILTSVFAFSSVSAQAKPEGEAEPPTLDRLQRWDGGWIASGQRSGLYRVDFGRSMLRPLKHPKVERVLAVAQAGETSFLFGIIRDRGRLYRVSGDHSEEIDLPLAVLERPETWHLVASNKHLAFFDNVAINRLDLDHPYEWKRIPLKTELWSMRPYPCEARTSALTETHLFAAFDNGEFRGGLKTVSLTDGAVTHVDDDYQPATALAKDEQGRVWASWGQAHLGQYYGCLRVCEQGTWKLVSRVQRRAEAQKVNWPFAAQAFSGVASKSGRVFVLANGTGVFELQDGIWRQRLPGLLSGVGGDALAIDGDRVIIATSNEGVLVANLRTRTVQTLH